MRQTLAAADSSSNGSSSSVTSDSVANTVDELDEAESSMDDEDSGAGDSGNGGNKQQQQQRHATSSAAFASACQAQLQKGGLLGALVAAAYPDRIAQLKPGSSGKAAYSLSNGELFTPVVVLLGSTPSATAGAVLLSRLLCQICLTGAGMCLGPAGLYS
jgi:hypothetical protein